MSDTPVDSSKRTWLIASGCAGAVGGVAVAVPFVSSFQPSEKAKAAGAAVEVDISALQARRKNHCGMARQACVDHQAHAGADWLRCPSSTSAGRSQVQAQSGPTPEYAQNEHRSIKPEILVAWAFAPTWGARPRDKFKTGPQPSLPDDWEGGFLCPCHGSTFDMAGRVFKNKPSPDNLEVPPHMYLSRYASADR
jgi:ubiquinol-cytochrome c reductase iron-sulfur subunit